MYVDTLGLAAVAGGGGDIPLSKHGGTNCLQGDIENGRWAPSWPNLEGSCAIEFVVGKFSVAVLRNSKSSHLPLLVSKKM